MKEMEELQKMTVGDMISALDGAAGRLIVARTSDKAVAEAHEMILEVSLALGELADKKGWE